MSLARFVCQAGCAALLVTGVSFGQEGVVSGEQPIGRAPEEGVHALHGKKIRVTGTDKPSSRPTIALPFEGDPMPEGAEVRVEQMATGRQYPATLKDGVFTFVPLGADANQEITFQIHATKPAYEVSPVVRLEKLADKDVIEVYIEDQLFTAYHYGQDLKKSFLWPVNSEDGIPVTRSYPMDETDIPKYAMDHPHHRSWWTSYGDVQGGDFWMENEGAGIQKSGEVTFGSGDAYGWILAKNTWNKADGTPAVEEEREYRFYASDPDHRITDMRVTFRAGAEAVKFGDTKEGGICAVRMRPELSYRNGIITNALGDVGEENCWGKPAAWCDMSGPIEGHGKRGLAIMDNPGNLRYPTSWHVRKYGLMGANCFGYSHFREMEYNKDLPESGDYTIEPGKELTFNYRVLVHSGDATDAKVGERYADYTNPPKAEWTE